MEPLEIKLSEQVLFRLKDTLNKLKKKSLANLQGEPSFHLFVIEQSYVQLLRTKIGFAWPESRPREARLKTKGLERDKAA